MVFNGKLWQLPKQLFTFSSFCLQQVIYSFGFINLFFRKGVLAHLFSFSPSTLILKQCEVAETIYANSLRHIRIHKGKGMLCLLTHFCYIKVPPPSPGQTSPIYFPHPPPPQKKMSTGRLKR